MTLAITIFAAITAVLVIWIMTEIRDVLRDIRDELMAANVLARESWDSDYLEDRLAKPRKVRT